MVEGMLTLTMPGRTANDTIDFSSFAYVRQREFNAAYKTVQIKYFAEYVRSEQRRRMRRTLELL